MSRPRHRAPLPPRHRHLALSPPLLATHLPSLARFLQLAKAAPPATKPNGKPSSNGKPDDRTRRLQKNQELHEVKELERLFAQIKEYSLSIDDYFLTQEESVSGEKLPTRYALLYEDNFYDVPGVAQILPEVLKIAKGPMEVKRFKGLGEMNAEQLWETTLDPSRAHSCASRSTKQRKPNACSAS